MKIVRPITVNNARLQSSNIAETDYSAYDPAHTYTLGNRAIYISGEEHWVIESLVAGNLGNIPTGLATDTKWLKVSNTNRWRMFDQSVNSQSTHADYIEVVLQTLGPLDSLILLNLDAESIHVVVEDITAGIVYDQTYQLVSNRGVTSWYDFFYEPYERLSDFIVTDLPRYIDTTVTIRINKIGATAACGACILGLSKIIGGVQYGAKTGITDYSIKTTDEFGNYEILQRAFSKYASLTLTVDKSLTDVVMRLLTEYRATPIVYIGSDLRRSTWIYGFYKDFYETIAYPNESIYTLELEGLT